METATHHICIYHATPIGLGQGLNLHLPSQRNSEFRPEKMKLVCHYCRVRKHCPIYFEKGPVLQFFTVNNSNRSQSCNSGRASKCWLSLFALPGYPGITVNIPQPTQSCKVITVNCPFFTQISGRNFLPELAGDVHPETAPFNAL